MTTVVAQLQGISVKGWHSLRGDTFCNTGEQGVIYLFLLCSLKEQRRSVNRTDSREPVFLGVESRPRQEAESLPEREGGQMAEGEAGGWRKGSGLAQGL